jgi:hypothetical protein
MFQSPPELLIAQALDSDFFDFENISNEPGCGSIEFAD